MRRLKMFRLKIWSVKVLFIVWLSVDDRNEHQTVERVIFLFIFFFGAGGPADPVISSV